MGETESLVMPAAFCRHFSRLLHCGVCCLNSDNSIRFAFKSGEPASHYEDGELIRALFEDEKVCALPTFKATRPGETYIALDVTEKNGFKSRFEAGPIMALSEDGSANENRNSALSAAIFMYFCIYGEWLDEKELERNLSMQERNSKKTELNRSKHTLRTQSSRHHSVAYESHIYSLITDGCFDRIPEIIREVPDGEYGLLDREHPLRNIKDDCICMITLATRSAEAGGLDHEAAFSLSDEAIQAIEQKKDVDSLKTLVIDTLCHFAKLVSEAKNQGCSYRIARCRNYIINRVYEKLSVSSVAAGFGLSSEYLSEQFRNETGERLIDFIKGARAAEARRLLLYSEKSILEISSLLNYHDQSHFTKSFKAVYGMTPRSCRKTGM